MRASRFFLLMTLSVFFGWGLFSCSSSESDTSEAKTFSIQYEVVESVCGANIRGLFLVNDSVGWASGASGTFLRTTDGENWSADTIPGYTHLDFRDVHAFDANTALLMAAGEEGRVLRTEDGGISWVEVYTRLDSGIFLDGMDFFENVGYCYGDPIDGKFVLIRSDDFGKTWNEVAEELLPDALPNEAGFAASGTGIVVKQKDIWIATGGDSSRILWWKADQSVWMQSGSFMRQGEGCGVFSMCHLDSAKLMLVGGCYLDSTNADGNSAIFDYSAYDSETSQKWSYSVQFQFKSKPRGYRSCVSYSPNEQLLVTCGRTGVEYSLDQGENWLPITDNGYYVCAFAEKSGWMIGKRGKMAKLSW